jgi:hypothetical protein
VPVCLVSGTGSAVREVQGVFSVFFIVERAYVGTISVNVLLQYLFRFFLVFFSPFFVMYSCYSDSLWCSRHFFLNISQQILDYSMFSSFPSLVCLLRLRYLSNYFRCNPSLCVISGVYKFFCAYFFSIPFRYCFSRYNVLFHVYPFFVVKYLSFF